VKNGFKSLNDVARQYGRDVEEVFQQMQSDKAMAERYGITLMFEPLGTVHSPTHPTGADVDRPDEDEEDNA